MYASVANRFDIWQNDYAGMSLGSLLPHLEVLDTKATKEGKLASAEFLFPLTFLFWWT